jgi:hypothetical protein
MLWDSGSWCLLFILFSVNNGPAECIMEIKTIGRREFIGLPDFGILAVEAKVDTGAYTSALHCSVIEEEQSECGMRLKVSLFDESHPEYSKQFHYFQRYEQTQIRSSNGDVEERYVVITSIRIYGRRYMTRFSLTNRENMKYPVLLGRRCLKGRFIVDVAALHAAGMPVPPRKVKKTRLKKKKKK